MELGCWGEPCLRQAVWGLGMETYEVQRVCTTGCSHSWVPPFTSGKAWGQQHLYHLGTW